MKQKQNVKKENPPKQSLVRRITKILTTPPISTTEPNKTPHANTTQTTNTLPETLPNTPTAASTPTPANASAKIPLDLHERYLAPPPTGKGKIIGIDCHPDTFTWAVYTGTTQHNAQRHSLHADLPLSDLIQWATQHARAEDTFLLEASSNSFEICRQLHALGHTAHVLESTHVGAAAAQHCDNDKIAASRIVLVYLIGKAPAVWQPDPLTLERRELLHAQQSAVSTHTAAVNTLKSLLNQHTIRLGKRDLTAPATAAWIKKQRDWSDLQLILIEDHLHQITVQKQRRRHLYRQISRQISEAPPILRTLNILGIGILNAFALHALIGDIRRFASYESLVSYLGLSPGQRTSGNGKDIKVKVRGHGRRDLRPLLIQGAQAVLRNGRDTTVGKWGWKLFARKGNRNIAIVAIARKLIVQVWHNLMGHPELQEQQGKEKGQKAQNAQNAQKAKREKSLNLKLQKVIVSLGKDLRAVMGIPAGVAAGVQWLQEKLLTLTPQPKEKHATP